MKKLLIFFIPLFTTLMFSSYSFGKWTKEVTSENDITVYIDYDRINKKNGFIYYRVLYDRITPNRLGSYSVMEVSQGDCVVYRLKILIQHQHKKNMGEGSYRTIKGSDNWIYPKTNSLYGYVLDKVCSN